MFLFKEGRCTVGFDNPVYTIYLDEAGVVHGDVYLNAKGMVCSNGAVSYTHLKKQNVKIGKLWNNKF